MMSNPIITNVGKLLTAIDKNELTGEVQVSGRDGGPILWLCRYAKAHDYPGITRDLLMGLVKEVSEFHGMSLVQIFRLSLFDFRKRLQEAGIAHPDEKLGVSRKKTCRLSVQIDPPIATLDGTIYPIRENAAMFLHVLIAAEGKPRSGKDVATEFEIFPADKINRVRKSLPDPILAFVECKPGSGSWLRDEAWIN